MPVEPETDAVALLAEVKALAKRYYAATGRPLGVTGEIAEFEAVRLLGLEIAPVRQSGWDASEPDGGRRYQVKGRALRSGAPAGQRVGSLSAAKEWDAVLLVILDESFDAREIWEADRKDVLTLLERPGSRARTERGQLGVQQLIRISRQRWGDEPKKTRRSLSSAHVEQRPDGAVRYHFSRLCFKANVIEPLADNDVFEVVTPSGLFRMTKRQFCNEFGKVRESASYREGRIYHFPSPPRRAEQFRVSVPRSV